jgi:hypothetical protein
MVYELDTARVCSPAHAVAMHGAAPAIPGFQAVRTRAQAALTVAGISVGAKSGSTEIGSRLPGHPCFPGDSFDVLSNYRRFLAALLQNRSIIAVFCADVNM